MAQVPVGSPTSWAWNNVSQADMNPNQPPAKLSAYPLVLGTDVPHDTPTGIGFTAYPVNLSVDTDRTLHPTGTATSTTNYPSYALQLQRSYWTGSAAATGTSKLNVDSAGVLWFTNESGTGVASVDQSGNIAGNELILPNSITLLTDSGPGLQVVMGSGGIIRFTTQGGVNWLESVNGAGNASQALEIAGAGGAALSTFAVNASTVSVTGQLTISGGWTSANTGTLQPQGAATSTTNYPSYALQFQRSYWTTAAQTGTSKLNVDTVGTLWFTNESGTGVFSVSQVGAVTANLGTNNIVAFTATSSSAGWGSGIQFVNTATGGRTYGFYTDNANPSVFHGTDVTASIDWLTVNGSARTLTLAPASGWKVATFSNILDDGTGKAAIAGPITSIGGQSTSGPLGTGAVVAQVEAATVGTASAWTTYLSFTTAVNGLYLVSGYAANTTTASQTVGVRVTWTDPNIGASYGQTYSLAYSSGVGTNSALPASSVLIYAQSGSTIAVQGYTSSATGVYFSAAIVRLA
jgi:hypothetical protein